MEFNFMVDNLTREALNQCARQDISIQRPLMRFMVEWLLVSRGGKWNHIEKENISTVCQSICTQIIENGPVVRMFKLAHSFKNCTGDQEEVQMKYEKITKEKLVPLLENICSFTGSGRKDQEEIYQKMTVYIVASNKMFSTKNSEMLSEAKCALRSILTTQDLIDFVTRKKHYRLDYLERLGKIMCGILLFNKHVGLGGEPIRDVVNDIHVAYQNTQESIRCNMAKCNQLIALGLRALSATVTVNLADNKVIYRLPAGVSMVDLNFFNKHIYLQLQHEIYMDQLKEPLTKLKNKIEHYIGQLKEVLFKLHDVVKFRLAIPSELVFPNFAKLFETWYQILMQLYYLVEVNRNNDEMCEIVSSTEYPFEEMAAKIGSGPAVQSFEVDIGDMDNADEEPAILRTNRKTTTFFSEPLQRFCALTMAVANGILVQAEPTYGVLPFQEQFMAFKRKDYGAFAEKNLKSLVKRFLGTAFQNPEMCLLFNIPIDSSPLNRITKAGHVEEITKKKSFDVGLQTEHCVPPCSMEARNSYSWNMWNYRRRAIQLANLRKCQTHSTQTNITYSSKDAAIQTFDKTSSTHRCICSSSP